MEEREAACEDDSSVSCEHEEERSEDNESIFTDALEMDSGRAESDEMSF